LWLRAVCARVLASGVKEKASEWQCFVGQQDWWLMVVGKCQRRKRGKGKRHKKEGRTDEKGKEARKGRK